MATSSTLAPAAAAPPSASAAQPAGLKRQQHWATRAFHQFLLSRAKTPFAWGANDCALFAADGIQAMTGVDIAADFRGKYSDQAGALEAIRTIAGGTTIADAAAYCAAKHGLAEWARPLCAQRGDLVVFENGGDAIAGLVHLSGAHLISVGQQGIVRVPVTKILRAWHVGPSTVPAARGSWHIPPAWKSQPGGNRKAATVTMPAPTKALPNATAQLLLAAASRAALKAIAAPAPAAKEPNVQSH